MRAQIKGFLFVALSIVMFSGTVSADYVKGYTRRDGTYVQGYNRSSPNNTVRDNYSHRGNLNPYTGETGSNYNRNSPSSEYYGTGNSWGSDRY